MTLYDLLGALPDDDAEGLRTAFRRAVKSAHPDIHPGDPDAAWKFRRIVRAHDILGDAEQRAAYDHLLDLAHLEEASASGQATAARIHKIASGVIALAAASAVTVGGYLLLMHMSVASVAPADKISRAMHASASVSPVPAPVTAANSTSVVKNEGAVIAGEAIEPSAAIHQTNAEPVPAANVSLAPNPATSDASPTRARSASAHRDGNLTVAIADQASLPDPKFSPAYIDRGVIFYRLRKFERAFADLAPAKPIDRPGRARSAPTAGAPRLSPVAIARPPMPVPRRRAVAQDPSREESVALVRVR